MGWGYGKYLFRIQDLGVSKDPDPRHRGNIWPNIKLDFFSFIVNLFFTSKELVD
jgi:hypothetical protein